MQEANVAAAISERMREHKQRQSKRQRWEDARGDDRDQRLSAAQSRISALYGTAAAPSEPGSTSSDGVPLMVQHWAGRIKEVPAWANAEA